MARSRKHSASLPDDASERARRDATREMMRRHDYEVTDAGVEKWRERLAALDRMRDDAA